MSKTTKYQGLNILGKYKKNDKEYQNFSYRDEKGYRRYASILLKKGTIIKEGNEANGWIGKVKVKRQAPPLPTKPRPEKGEVKRLQDKIKRLTEKLKEAKKKPKKKRLLGTVTIIGNDKGFKLALKRKKLKQIAEKTIEIKPVAVTESSTKMLSIFFDRLINQVKGQVSNITSSGGIELYIKINFKSLDYEKAYSQYNRVFNGKSTRKDILRELNAMTTRHYNTENYILYAYEIVFLILPLSTKGGCNNNVSSSKYIKDEEGKNAIVLKSYQSKNDNCLIAVFNKHYQVKGNVIKSSLVRNKLKIPDGKVDIKYIPELVKFYNKQTKRKEGYLVCNQKEEIIMLDNVIDNSYINIHLILDHYYHAISLEKIQCPDCGTKYRLKHTCNSKRISFMKHKRNSKILTERDYTETQETDYDKVINFDLETFIGDTNKAWIPYAVGWDHKGDYNMEYGLGCMDRFLDVMMTKKDCILNAYNGANFDHYFLINSLIKKGVPIIKIIKSNGRVLSFTFGQNNKVFDLCLFMNSTLDKACKDFDTIIKKGDFKHEQIKSWADVETYKHEWEPYLVSDVKSLKELFENFNKMMYSMEKINIVSYITLSHMGYNIWLNTIGKKKIHVPNEEEYNFVRKGTYGGRTYPNQKEFISQTYLKLKDQPNINIYEEIKKSNDYIFNGDATSLYPASMKGFDLCQVKYPLGKSRWTDESETDYKNGKLGYYNIAFVCPKNITVPILPRRKENGGVSWDLTDGQGVYCSIDIDNAVSSGYKIKFIGKAIVWDESGDIFGEYIDKWFKMKEDAVKSGEKVKKSIAKLLLNSLYGKMLQKALFSNTEIINSSLEFNKFCVKHKLTDWTKLNNSKQYMLTGETVDKEAKITKPTQLGGFVTAYSRKIMLLYMKAIDPTLKKICMTYTDTDSLHLKAKDYNKLVDLGMIVTKDNAKLGYLCSDIDGEGLIIHEKCLGPKSYFYSYINNKNIMGTTNKTKGIAQEALNKDMFIKDEPKETEFKCFKKVHKKVTKEQRKEGIENFSVMHINCKRTFNKTKWEGMQWIENKNVWVPYGWNGDINNLTE